MTAQPKTPQEKPLSVVKTEEETRVAEAQAELKAAEAALMKTQAELANIRAAANDAEEAAMEAQKAFETGPTDQAFMKQSVTAQVAKNSKARVEEFEPSVTQAEATLDAARDRLKQAKMALSGTRLTRRMDDALETLMVAIVELDDVLASSEATELPMTVRERLRDFANTRTRTLGSFQVAAGGAIAFNSTIPALEFQEFHESKSVPKQSFPQCERHLEIIIRRPPQGMMHSTPSEGPGPEAA